MASKFYDNGLLKLTDGTIAPVSDGAIKIMLVDTTYAFNAAETSMATATSGPTAHETAATGYTGGFNGASRQALAGKSITLDAANHRVKFNASNVTWNTLNGATLGGAVIFWQGASDAASIPLAFVDPTDLVLNGSNVQYQPDATNGVWFLQN